MQRIVLIIILSAILFLIGHYGIDPNLDAESYSFSVFINECGHIDDFHLDIDVRKEMAELIFVPNFCSYPVTMAVFFPNTLKPSITSGPEPDSIDKRSLVWSNFSGTINGKKVDIKFNGKIKPNGLFLLGSNLERVYSGIINHTFPYERIRIKLSNNYQLNNHPVDLSGSEVFTLNSKDGEIIYIIKKTGSDVKIAISTSNAQRLFRQRLFEDVGLGLILISVGFLLRSFLKS